MEYICLTLQVDSKSELQRMKSKLILGIVFLQIILMVSMPVAYSYCTKGEIRPASDDQHCGGEKTCDKCYEQVIYSPVTETFEVCDWGEIYGGVPCESYETCHSDIVSGSSRVTRTGAAVGRATQNCDFDPDKFGSITDYSIFNKNSGVDTHFNGVVTSMYDVFLQGYRPWQIERQYTEQCCE